jgi:hypothetical protein
MEEEAAAAIDAIDRRGGQARRIDSMVVAIASA